MEYNLAPCKIGGGPFIFVSYAHEDVSVVSTVIDGIIASGYKVWYDKNIDVSSLWSDEIANAILASKVFIVFVTKASMASQYVRSEVEFALGKKVKVIPIYLEGMNVLPPGLSLILHSTQGLEGNNPQLITFKICKWLAQNWEESGKSPSSLVPVAPVSRDLEESGEEEGVVRNFFHRKTAKKPEKPAYMEETPRVLGHASGVPTASSFSLKWLLRIVLFTNLTELIQIYLQSGSQMFFAPETFIYWIIPTVIIRWYFARRFSGPYSLFSRGRTLLFLQSLLYWTFLLGWLIWVVHLDSFKIWVVWIAQAGAWLRIPYVLNYKAILALNLPVLPEEVQTAGFWAAAGSSGLLFVDMLVAFFRSKFY
ncbi:MAG: toll/interleukin-1 receptor domain-containing protein [Synergistaceae bacterium]|jgi:hypothetical protein|nr:toll/interleukin-1 receptor domain-containing protein [Synergistaceae bacterium]